MFQQVYHKPLSFQSQQLFQHHSQSPSHQHGIHQLLSQLLLLHQSQLHKLLPFHLTLQLLLLAIHKFHQLFQAQLLHQFHQIKLQQFQQANLFMSQQLYWFQHQSIPQSSFQQLKLETFHHHKFTQLFKRPVLLLFQAATSQFQYHQALLLLSHKLKLKLFHNQLLWLFNQLPPALKS